MDDETPKDAAPARDDPGERAGDFERYALIAAITLVVLCLLVWDKRHGDAPRTAPVVRPDRELRVEIGGGAPSASSAAGPAAPRASSDPPPTPAPAPTPQPTTRTYVVKSGDTLYDIAKRELGSSARVKDVVDLNHLADAAAIKPGQTLVLPAK